MPKGNPGRLKSRFEIRGELTPNEHEFQQHHGEMTEHEHENSPSAEGQEGEADASLSPQEREAARIAEVEARAHEIVKRRHARQTKSASSSAKKSGKNGAEKSAKKGSSKKSAKRR
jgi:hypothetical protein